MDTARTLEEKRERVLEQMRAIRSMRPGSVTEQYLKVTHKGKRKPVMRGPYWVYTRKEAGKTVGQRLSREDAEQVKKDIEAHRKFVALCMRWTPFSGPKWGVAKVEPAELNTSWS